MSAQQSANQILDQQKIGTWLFAKSEQRIIRKIVPKIPHWIQTYHLTLLTVLWSGVIILSGWLGRGNIAWLWVSSLMIACQYFTDILDGALGRFRNTGLIKWGYYMDHFLDYLFFCSILISYSLISSGYSTYLLFFVMAVFGAYMVNTFLSCQATNELKIGYFRIGPTEIRIAFIIINALIIFDQTYLKKTIPFVLAVSFIVLSIIVFRTQRYIWKIDMAKMNS